MLCTSGFCTQVSLVSWLSPSRPSFFCCCSLWSSPDLWSELSAHRGPGGAPLLPLYPRPGPGSGRAVSPQTGRLKTVRRSFLFWSFLWLHPCTYPAAEGATDLKQIHSSEKETQSSPESSPRRSSPQSGRSVVPCRACACLSAETSLGGCSETFTHGFSGLCDRHRGLRLASAQLALSTAAGRILSLGTNGLFQMRRGSVGIQEGLGTGHVSCQACGFPGLGRRKVQFLRSLVLGDSRSAGPICCSHPAEKLKAGLPPVKLSSSHSTLNSRFQ